MAIYTDRASTCSTQLGRKRYELYDEQDGPKRWDDQLPFSKDKTYFNQCM